MSCRGPHSDWKPRPWPSGPAVPSAPDIADFMQLHSQGSPNPQTLHGAAFTWPVGLRAEVAPLTSHSPLAALKGQRPRRHRELCFSEESQAKQMVGIQLAEYLCTLIKQSSCGPLNFPSLNEHQPA